MEQQFYHAMGLRRFIDEELKNEINTACDKLGQAYDHSNPSDPSLLNFGSDRALRQAYIYRYFACHVNAVRESFSMLFETENVQFNSLIRKDSQLNICCVGGGPGPDLVGFCHFLNSRGVEMKLNASILDLYGWSVEGRKMMSKLNAYGIADYEYVNYNLFKPITPAVTKKIETADLVTVVRFLSAVDRDGIRLSEFVDLIRLLKPNARLFFMDNSGGGFYERMESAAQLAGLALVSEIRNVVIKIPDSEWNQMTPAPLRKNL